MIAIVALVANRPYQTLLCEVLKLNSACCPIIYVIRDSDFDMNQSRPVQHVLFVK